MRKLLFTFLLFPFPTYSQNTTNYGPDNFIPIDENQGGFTSELESGGRFSLFTRLEFQQHRESTTREELSNKV